MLGTRLFIRLTILFLLVPLPLLAQEGQPAPDFTLKDLEGKSYTLSELKGKVVLLDFWATWCRPCVVSIPHLNELNSRFQGEEFLLLGINVDRYKSTSSLKRFVKQYEINYPILTDKSGEVAARYRAFALPTSFLINREGKIAKRILGSNPSLLQELEAEVEKLLKEASTEEGEE
jgi:cytochrome c biogenesis protein CcmG/thiol:disulfide interchange protein DsbE